MEGRNLFEKMNTVEDIEKEIIEEFEQFDDWMEKYEHIIDLGKSLPLIEEQYKTEDRLIVGCQSKVWLYSEMVEGRIVFSADSDAIITKGLVALMIRVLSNHAPEEIVNAPMDFIDKIGLKEHLSMTRGNGLANMIKQMKMYALKKGI